jgi:NAD-dependent SIR2 family protein deacetylase
MDAAHEPAIDRAAEIIAAADALVIASGAGMGVDSGLPDFRGVEGFWRAYPPFAALGLDFAAVANPVWFERDPALAWGFYGHRLNLYRQALPHEGFAIVNAWAAAKMRGAFVFTSNVDGHFQRAGFDPERIVEVHGAIDWMQCTRECGVGIFPADDYAVELDAATFRARPPLPTCPRCNALARPSILMFGDADWDPARYDLQRRRLNSWLSSIAGARLAILEFGAGTAVPTVRWFCERLASNTGGTLIRVNPRESEVPAGHLSLPLGALAALRAIAERMPTS